MSPGSRILSELRVRRGRWRPGLEEWAGRIGEAVAVRGYSASRPLISAGSAFASIRIPFGPGDHIYTLRVQAEGYGMVMRHVSGYARERGAERAGHLKWAVLRLLGVEAPEEDWEVPVLEIYWGRAPPGPLIGLTLLTHQRWGAPVGVAFDREAGRTSPGGGLGFCRVALLRPEARWEHLLQLLAHLIPPRPQIFK